MDLKWLKTFITVYEEGSFRAAADKLFISQPSITVHIKALEQELQVALFDREHTKVKLTQAGEQYYEMAKKLLAQIEDSTHEIRKVATRDQIHLVVALASNVATPNVLSLIQAFKREHPNYDIELVMDDAKQTDLLLRSRQVDIAISYNKTKSKDLHSEQYATSHMQLMYSRELFVEGDSHNARLRYLLATYPLYVGFMDEHAPILENLQREYTIHRIIRLADSDFVHKLVKQGLAISMAPTFLIEGDSATDQLCTLGLGGIAKIYPIQLYLNHVRYNDAVQPFLKFLREQGRSKFQEG
jgi:LysR family transcriptional regulator, repressor for citA